MLAHRLRRLPNIGLALGPYLVFAVCTLDTRLETLSPEYRERVTPTSARQAAAITTVLDTAFWL